MKLREINNKAALIFVMLCTVVYLAAAPMLHAKAQPAYGSGEGPKEHISAGIEKTLVAALEESRDSVNTAAENAKAKAIDAKAAREKAEKIGELKKKASAARKAAQEKKTGTGENTDSTGSAGTVADPEDSSGGYQIMGTSDITADQMARRFASVASYPAVALKAGGASTIESFCQIIVEEAQAEGVKPEVVFAQAMVETGWLKFGGSDSITQYNFAGLGTVGDGNPGNAFKDVRTGIRAQVQHLKAYASDEPLNGELVDQRFDKVVRLSAPIVEWLGMPDNPYGLGWAGGQGYGNKILKIISDTRSM